MSSRSPHRLAPLFFMLLAILLLAACQPAAPAAPTAPVASPPPPQPTLLPTEPIGVIQTGISLDSSAVAQSATLETVPAQTAAPDSPNWEGAPEFQKLTLQGYPVAGHPIQPQIFIYPVADLAAANKRMGEAAADLQALLQSRQPGEQIPYLPLLASAKEVLIARVDYLDFQGGSGVRFLTQAGNGLAPVNNSALVYTFQGLTSDGKYYVSAVLPVTHPALGAETIPDEEMINAITADQGYYASYLAERTAWLEAQSEASFTPDLDSLDALIRSIEVR
jgi:hypothetical protein